MSATLKQVQIDKHIMLHYAINFAAQNLKKNLRNPAPNQTAPMKINKVRITGIILLIVGITARFALDDTYSFLYGMLIGAGIALVVTGKIKSPI
ncbi:hypothetical protein GILI108418_15485 [Gillisia limnaea]|uniref:Uncharacterized protein n=2 Tax=Gillisia TaxID=244698 RepID=H2BRQ9_GILLR|nr:hypothetical protein Gilli_0663 [Gillisia limnaea DSM 15749]